jgi:hypothetical protein
VGPLTALAFVLIIGEAEGFQTGKQGASWSVSAGRLQRESKTARTHHQTRKSDPALLAEY